MSDKKNGNSHAILENASLRSKKMRQVRKYSVKDAIQALPKEENEEMDWGRPAGREIW